MQNLQIICLLLFLCGTLNAQISEGERRMSLGMRNAVMLDLPDTERKFVEKCWKDYMKEFDGKTRKNKKAGEWFSDNCEIVGIGGSRPIDVFAKVEEEGDDTELAFWVDYGDEFMTSDSHPDAYAETEKFLMRFALYVAKERTELELQAEEKRLKKQKQSLKRLKRDNDRYHRDIEQAKDRIRKAEANIEKNEADQGEANKQIELQEEVIEEVKRRLQDF
ncbi:MAG: hypothetical protein AAFV95_11665 [Bacteroidota bacterium]